ncbi:hypothetical protein HK098_006400 [Nowakowskiella sp. JEL0407]|nr:hypothetical protein HK098_006400 [Nowakowskiella sp. JEL0407]
MNNSISEPLSEYDQRLLFEEAQRKIANEKIKQAETLAESKLKMYSKNSSRKGAIHKQQEASEAKKKLEEERAAEVLNEFVASFGEDSQNNVNERLWVASGSGGSASRTYKLNSNTSALQSSDKYPKASESKFDNSNRSNFSSTKPDKPSALRPFTPMSSQKKLPVTINFSHKSRNINTVQNSTPAPAILNSTISSKPRTESNQIETKNYPFGASINQSRASSVPSIQFVKPSTTLLPIIHRTIERVLIHGPEFESIVSERERGNPDFGFLFNFLSDEHKYYRWKLYSMLQGDDTHKWRSEPFQIYDDGIIWIPPDVPFQEDRSDYESDSSSSSSSIYTAPKQNSTKLSARTRRIFEKQLRRLKSSRMSIGKTMYFCIQNSLHASELTSILTSSLILRSTPVQKKISRFYLLSDLLFNCSTSFPNAWKYRSEIEKSVPVVLSHLGEIWKEIKERLKAEQFKRVIFGVLSVWESWAVFPKETMDNWRNLFLGVKEDDKFEAKKENAMESDSTTGRLETNFAADEEAFISNFKPLEESNESTGMWKAVEETVVDNWMPVGGNETVSVWNVVEEGVDAGGNRSIHQTVDSDAPDDEDIDGIPLEDLDGEPMTLDTAEQETFALSQSFIKEGVDMFERECRIKGLSPSNDEIENLKTELKILKVQDGGEREGIANLVKVALEKTMNSNDDIFN